MNLLVLVGVVKTCEGGEFGGLQAMCGRVIEGGGGETTVIAIYST